MSDVSCRKPVLAFTDGFRRGVQSGFAKHLIDQLQGEFPRARAASPNSTSMA